ncbi:MAG: hypothetical protein JWO86_3152 [Myxococcaceae bacterium]|nr:hypothetical protein [Myxococcaceae bacterium]
MRQLRLLALLAPVLLLPVACENSSSSPSAPFTFEAGPGFEAGPSPEAGPLEDAGIDAADVFVPPAPTGVTVTVVQGLAPQADVRVISQDATGAVIGDQKTDATGKLLITTVPNMVTVLATRSGAPTPVTFYAVAEGDNLVVRIEQPLPEPSTVSSYSVTFTPPAVAPIPNANVVVNGSCYGNTTDTASPVLIGLYANCALAANAILAEGSNIAGVRLGFAFKKSVPAPAANATDNVLLGAWTAPGQTTLIASNRPAGTLSLSSDLYMIANGAAFMATGGGALDDGGVNYATATGFSDAYQSFVRADGNFANANVETAFIRREAVPAAATLADFDFAAALPYITGAAIDTTTTARPSITLTSGSLAAADGGAVAISWSTAAETLGTWTFVLPASAAATFKVPALPADATTFIPSTAPSIDSVVFFEATQIPGYKETKSLPITPTVTLDLQNGALPLPTNGTVRFTTWSPAPPTR